ncbi:type I pantothenate kinase [Fructobacillus sp. M1-13]|uniref:Type I pantothenate kinase n=1 Tax=Fructobacillus papyriferae TaxID=2713171 RepID=A0ABS5QT83_9LACO|nr:type I pantothenate kinase [Fructobacillus papyriferae]MBS9335157.1 type I pantothenate kinase [Fructobacillus papyriferae]MCD2159173.1 type I pantothenate kinase [Fructobacillus papyriferae]
MIENVMKQIEKAQTGAFFTVGLTGSVAVGKSTLAERLSTGLEAAGYRVAIMSTDDFLKSNAELHEEGFFDEKGFPQSYDLKGLRDFVQNFRDGQAVQTTQKYSQTLADIVPGRFVRIDRPDILILEGVVSLQLPSELLDFTVFIEAAMSDIKDWYLSRNLLATVKSIGDDKSWRSQYSHMALSDFYDLAMTVWEKTNQKNYDEYIVKSKRKADWVLHLDSYHQLTGIEKGPRTL